MTTDLTVIDVQELNAFIEKTGTSAEDLTGGGDYIPNLRINYHDEDANGKEIKPGLFFVTNQDIPVYAKTVRIRPLLQHFQWTQWDDDNKKTTNRTIFITNFNEEARDENGTVRCGKPPSKVLKDNKELQKQYEDITCFRTVHALVTYTGNDADGKEHTIENLPVVLRLKGDNFMPFQEEYLNNLPRGSLIWDYEINLSTTKHKVGTVNYYIMHFDADFANKVPLTVDVFETMKIMQSRIEALNRDIEKKYLEHFQQTVDSNAAINALDITPRRLEDDFPTDDDIPF